MPDEMAIAATSGWTALALRYGTVERPAREFGLGDDPHDAPVRMDYFVWVVRLPGRVVLFDTGFEAGEASRRGRTMLLRPVEALDEVGIAAEDVTDVVVSHLHYDHAGNLGDFPAARFHIQAREMAFATGPCMCHRLMRRAFSCGDVVSALRLVFADRVTFHDGDAEIAPGLTAHLVGGHSRGLQVLRLARSDGPPVVLASDALHFSALMEAGDVFPVLADLADVLDGYRRLAALAGPAGVIVPGHDPAVMDAFPALAGAASGYARVLA